MRVLLLLLQFVLVLPALASSETVTDIEYRLAAATSMGDDQELGLAMAELLSYACAGDPDAAALIGERYLTGAGEFEASPGKAKIFLRGAAQAGLWRAMPGLVILLSRDGSTQAEIEEAAKWLKIGRALSHDALELVVASQAFEISRGGRDVAEGYQAAAVWLQKRNQERTSPDHASIDCSSW